MAAARKVTLTESLYIYELLPLMYSGCQSHQFKDTKLNAMLTITLADGSYILTEALELFQHLVVEEGYVPRFSMTSNVAEGLFSRVHNDMVGSEMSVDMKTVKLLVMGGSFYAVSVTGEMHHYCPVDKLVRALNEKPVDFFLDLLRAQGATALPWLLGYMDYKVFNSTSYKCSADYYNAMEYLIARLNSVFAALSATKENVELACTYRDSISYCTRHFATDGITAQLDGFKATCEKMHAALVSSVTTTPPASLWDEVVALSTSTTNFETTYLNLVNKFPRRGDTVHLLAARQMQEQLAARKSMLDVAAWARLSCITAGLVQLMGQ